MSTSWVSIPQYAKRFGVDPKTAHKWLAAGLLVTFRVGRCIRVLNQPPTQIPELRKSKARGTSHLHKP